MGKEQWKVIPGYEPYEASNYGRIRRLHEDGYCILRQETLNTGYKAITVALPGGHKLRTVHRLVALAFIENPENKPCINHIDNDRANNMVENLEWCTYKENNNHRIKQGRGLIKHHIVGTNIETGEKLYFDGIEATRKYGFDPTCVCTCCRGQRSNGYPVHKHKGYTWEYVE